MQEYQLALRYWNRWAYSGIVAEIALMALGVWLNHRYGPLPCLIGYTGGWLTLILGYILWARRIQRRLAAMR